MSSTLSPLILVIDDDPEPQRVVFRGLHDLARFEVAHPDEVDEARLLTADLVLVDLRMEHWAARDNTPELWGKPVNGLALAAVLREHANQLGRTIGFALRSGHLSDISVTPAEPRVHTIARAHNLEWVFSKAPGESPNPTPGQAAILAAAIGRLPESWSPDDRARTVATVEQLLGLPGNAPWRSVALSDIENCHPPVAELSAKNHGLVFLRWVLQRIMPYPCFLHDSHRLAARLRASHASASLALMGGLGRWLEPVKYSGMVGGFLGDRWWRVGVEYLLWDLGGGAAMAPALLRTKLAAVAGVDLAPSPAVDPVVCLDENYQPLPEAEGPKAAVRIQPDDWPIYASQAWTTVALAQQHARLRAVVVEEDRHRVEPEAGT